MSKPNPCVLVCIDPGKKAGGSIMLGGRLIYHSAVADNPAERDMLFKLAKDVADGAMMPIVVVIEKFGAGIGKQKKFGARTLAGIERRVGQWVDAALRAGIKAKQIVRVLPQVWRARVLGKGTGPPEVIETLTRDYVRLRFDMIKEPESYDEVTAIAIGCWATVAAEVFAAIPSIKRKSA